MDLTVLTCFFAFVTAGFGKQHFHICGRSNHNGSNGELLPHNGVVPHGHDCNWHIYPESFNMPEVYMVLEEFKLEAEDRFTVSKHEGDLLFGPFSGTKESFTILTGALMLDVTLHTANSPSQDRQFKSFFTANDCYYLLEDASGFMTSPLYNDVKLRKTATCTWQFRKYKEVTLPRTVVFKTFHLINSTLTIKGSKAQDGIYSGTKLPGNVVAFGETQFLLNLNTSIPGETFSFQYGFNALNSAGTENNFEGTNDVTEVPSTKSLIESHHGACGIINLQSEYGWFFPKNETMMFHHSCLWTIEAEQESPGILIVIEEYDLVKDDQFVVRQTSPTGPILFGPYFGKKRCFSIFSDERKVDVVLTTSNNELLTKRHFRGYYSTIGCEYTIKNNIGVVYSPYYKTQDQKRTSCSWKFNELEVTSVLSISFDTYNLKSSQLLITNSLNQDRTYEGSNGPFDILMKANGILTLEIDRTVENETFIFSYKNVTPACSNYIKILGKESTSLSFPPASTFNPFDCQWIIEGSEKNVLAVYFADINITDPQDLLLIKDGKTRTSPTLVQITQNTQEHSKGSYVVSNTNIIWVSFSTRSPLTESWFKINVNISEQGGHLHNAQNFTISPPKSGVDVIYFLEVEKNEQILLNLFPGQDIPSTGVILVYNDFTDKSSLLTKLKRGKQFYPVVSTDSKMMIVAKGFDKDSSVKLGFKGVPKGCHQVTLDQHGIYTLSGNCNSTCSWAILPNFEHFYPDSEMLSVHLSSIALRPNDVVQVKQLDDNMTHIATITSAKNIMPNIYLPANYGAYITVTRENCATSYSDSTAFSSSVELLKGCSTIIDINPGEKVYLTSPNYPDTYPFNSHCYWNVSTKAKNLYIFFKTFQLSIGHYLKVHEMSSQHTVTSTTTYNSSDMPSDRMLQNNIAFELLASVNNSIQQSRGNGYLIEVFALDCGEVLGKEMKGTFGTPEYPKPIKGSLLCIWIVDVPPHNDDGSVNIVSFDIEWSSASPDDEKELIMHDGSSQRSEIIANSSKHTELLSKTNTVIFLYRIDDLTKEHAALKVNFVSGAGNNLCDNGIYIHPDWICNGVDDCGDYSDEKNCKGRAPEPPPVHPKPPNVVVTKTGISTAVFGSLLPVMFIVGILMTLFAAWGIKEIRRRREDSYDTLPILQ